MNNRWWKININSTSTRRALLSLGVALLPLLMLQTWTIPSTIAQTSVLNNEVAYLPLMDKAGSTQTTPTQTTPTQTTPTQTTPTQTTPTQTTPTEPSQDKGAFFFNKEAKNNSADIVLDKNGGMHAAYGYFTPDVENPPAVYTYCPGPTSACASAANWQSVKLANLVDEVQLALTPAGQPRMLIVATSTVYNSGKDYFYAACDQNCTDQNGWTITRIVSTAGTEIQDVNDQRMPQRSFALDPQGRPRFIYQDRNYMYAEPDHIGAYYIACDADCTDASNWQETEISLEINEQFRRDNEIFKYPSLTFTSAGQPRLVAQVFAFNEDGSDAEDGLYYYACDADCTTQSNWQRVFLVTTGSGSFPHPSWDLDLTANDQPRVALFMGDGVQPEEVVHRLLYLYCDTDCLNAGNWQYNNTGLSKGNGQSADLELDGSGRPRLAWIDNAGDLGYAWCNTNCESDQAQWQQQIVETEAMLKQEFPQAIPPHCDNDVWEGLAPAMALDSHGNPRITYDVSVEARCYYDETPEDPTDDPVIRFEPVWRGVHLAFFRQP